MDLMIKNMEMPTKVNHPLFVRISSDGHIAKGDFIKGGFIETEAKAIELPPHGELISKGNILFQLQVEVLSRIDPNDKDFDGIKKGILLARKAICDSPTILEASK